MRRVIYTRRLLDVQANQLSGHAISSQLAPIAGAIGLDFHKRKACFGNVK
jgi:hypothetical protein